jgi:hypothetical protein
VVGGYVMTPVCSDFILMIHDEATYKGVVSVRDVGTSSLSLGYGAIDLTGMAQFDFEKKQVFFQVNKSIVLQGIKTGQLRTRKEVE